MLIPRCRSRRLIPATAATAMALTVAVAPMAEAVDVTHTIADVQGTGAATPLAGTTVTVEGVVVANHLVGGYRGFYIQTEGTGGASDATPGASDGIFVFRGNLAPTTTVAIGQKVRVTGVAGEFTQAGSGATSSLTQVNASGTAAVLEDLGVSADPPVATALPDTVVGPAREQYEGMLVDPTGTYLVGSLHEASNFGSIWLTAGGDQLVTSTAVLSPTVDGDGDGTPDAQELAAANAARRIVLDDARTVNLAGAQRYLDPARPVRTGDAVELGDLTYVLSEGFGLQRLQPTTPIDAATAAAALPTFTSLNPRPQPVDVGGDLTVAAFNVLNYFTTLGARGAETAEELAAQKAKIVAAITALDADVVALQEIENSVRFGQATPDVALADLVAGLNAAAGAEVWAYVPTPTSLYGAGAPATDEIMSAIIYRSDTVTRVGDSVADVDETVWDIAREPIAQTFAPTAGGASFVVVANHFKSKSGSGAEPADGQGLFNAERVEEANALAGFVSEVTAAAGTQDVALLGDFNSYAQEDPITALTGAGFVDLLAAQPTEATYTFNGELGSLDHALVSPSFAARVTGGEVWDINADEWNGYEYWATTASAEAGSVYRASDHDPIRIGITAARPPVEIDILGINDVHGRLEAGGTNSPLVAGAAVLAGAVDAFRAENPDTLLVSAGDNIGASTFTSFIQQDNPTLDALNAMGLDVTALGNHEFDQGRDDIDTRVVPRSDFPYLAANVYEAGTTTPAYDEYWVTDVDGIDVGFVGAVTEELPSLVTPAGIASLDVGPVVPAVNRVASQLSDGDAANGEADVVVLLVHEGPATADLATSTDDSVFGRLVSDVSADVDVIFSGHTHQKFAHQIAVPGVGGVTRPVVQSGQYGENLAHVTLTVDPESGDVVSSEAAIVPLTAGAPTGAGLYPADPEVADIVASAVSVAELQGQVSLGQITADLNRARQADGTDNRGGESTLGNLVADVQLWATQELGTQIAFMNPGGLRANLSYPSTGAGDPDGNVTYKEAATVQPFANTLVTETLTGEQIVSVLEEQWQPAGASRPFLKLGVAGLTYTYDPTAAAGSRISEVMVGDTPLDLTGTYTVVVNSFLASGGDNFATLGEGASKADSGRVDLQAFVDYFAANSPLGPDLAQRAVGVHVADVPADGYAAGDVVTVDLSSLAFSAGETQPTEVTLTTGGRALGTFAVDPAIVDTTDEAGRATATFAVPEGLEGESFAVTATTATGTSATFHLPLAAVGVPTCTVEFDSHRFGRAFLGQVTVHNDNDSGIRGWTLTWQYTQGEKARAGIGAKVHQTGTTVTATSTRATERIRAGSSVTFGLVGTAPNGLGTPTGVALNGLPCTVAP